MPVLVDFPADSQWHLSGLLEGKAFTFRTYRLHGVGDRASGHGDSHALPGRTDIVIGLSLAPALVPIG